MPASSASIWAMIGLCFSTASASRWRCAPRSLGAMVAQPDFLKASAAAVTARSTSAAESTENSAIGSPVPGSRVGIVAPSDAATSLPPITPRSGDSDRKRSTSGRSFVDAVAVAMEHLALSGGREDVGRKHPPGVASQ